MRVINIYKGIFAPYNKVRTKEIQQFSNTECGAVALSILLSYYRDDVSFEELRDACGASRDGIKASTLVHVAKTRGHDAKGYKIDLEEVKKLKEPVIAFWKFNHYVVIEGFGNNKVFINDPASGRSTITLSEFDKAFTGVIISLIPNNELIKRPQRSFRIVDNLKLWLSHYKISIVFIFSCLLCLAVIQLIETVISRTFIEEVLIRNRIEWLYWIGGISLSLLIVNLSIHYGNLLSHHRLSLKIYAEKVSRLFNHLTRLPLMFYSLRSKGEVTASLHQVSMVADTFVKSAILFMIGVVTVALSLCVMLYLNKYLFMLSVVMTIMMMFIYRISGHYIFILKKRQMSNFTGLYSNAINIFSAYEQIKSNNYENLLLDERFSNLTNLYKNKDNVDSVSIILERLLEYTSHAKILLLMSLGIYLVSIGELRIGDLVAYFGIHYFFSSATLSLLPLVIEYNTANAANLRLNDILSYNIDRKFINDCTINKKTNISLVLECRNVAFHYNNFLPPTVNNLNFVINQGDFVSILGKSGAGKTTVLKLLSGLYTPSQGEILLYEKNMPELSHKCITANIAYISQSVRLLSGTLIENLTMLNENISDDELNRAIQLTCLSDFVENRGLNFIINENATNISGGERQRILLARILLRKTPVLILDEATSALDIYTEKKIINNLLGLNKTIIQVAHRFSTTELCKRVIVLDSGEIIAMGSHSELIETCETYRKLYEKESLNMKCQEIDND